MYASDFPCTYSKNVYFCTSWSNMDIYSSSHQRKPLINTKLFKHLQPTVFAASYSFSNCKTILRRTYFFFKLTDCLALSGTENWGIPKYKFQKLTVGCCLKSRIKWLIIRMFLWGRWQICYYYCGLKKLKADMVNKFNALRIGLLATLLNYN